MRHQDSAPQADPAPAYQDSAPHDPAMAGRDSAGRDSAVGADSVLVPAHSSLACARTWAALTAAHARIADQLSAELARACGMSINDFEILLRLDQVAAPGLRLCDLGTTVPLTQPALSRAVARLSDRGWLRRAAATNDRRGVLITITPAGREVLGRAGPAHARTIGEFLLDPLTPQEQDLLARALSRIAAGPRTAASSRSISAVTDEPSRSLVVTCSPENVPGPAQIDETGV